MNLIRGSRLYLWVPILAVIVLAALAWQGRQEIWRLVSDEQALEAAVTSWGAFGPLALIVINALQIVIAPIPGYVVQLAAGYLFGPWWGGFYAVCGLLLGSMIAMWFARTYGRPVAIWLIGGERLAHWETVTHSTSTLVWCLLLVGPVGDIPFALAGLSSVSYLKIFLLALFIRAPSVFLSTLIGGGALPVFWLVTLLIIAAVGTAVVLRFRVRLTAWFEQMVKAHIPRAEITNSD
jgi:uncharacterized membrane protein YdjX (TVP38/TMEM64 family)